MTDPNHAARPVHGLPLLLLLVLGANWGLGFTLAKIGVTGGLNPLAYVSWQCTGSGLALLAISALRGHLPPLDWTHLRYYLISGLANIAVPGLVAFTSVKHLPVGVVVLIVTLAPLLTYAVALVLRIEPLHRRRASGVVLGLLGTALILVPEASLPSPDAALWVLIAMLTPTFYAASSIYMAQARPVRVHSLTLAASMQLAAGVSLLPIAFATGEMHVLAPPFTAAELANMSHVFVSGFGALLYFEILRMGGPVFGTQVGYVVCLAGVFWGKLFFDEQHSVWVWAAMVVILCGLALVTWPAARRKV